MTVQELINLLQKQDPNKKIVHFSDAEPSPREVYAMKNGIVVNNLTRFSEKIEIIEGKESPMYYGKYANGLILSGAQV
jgi:hypothetical protein